MGTICNLAFSNYHLFYQKNLYYRKIISALFRPENFISKKRKYSSLNPNYWIDEVINKPGEFEFKGFAEKVSVCRKRLEIYGVSFESCKSDFEKAKIIAKKDGAYDSEYKFDIAKLEYQTYLDEVKDIIEKQEFSYEQDYSNLRESLKSFDLGINGQSLNCHLYSILSVLPDNAIVEYDLTELIDNGWAEELEIKSILTEKIIVLTEGKTDVEFISDSLKRLYPELSDYYHFIDFDNYKVESSASMLVKLVTAFAGAKVKHPIVALFDNDTTGIAELKRLKSVTLTPNIKTLKFPDIPFANNYPTIGPTGLYEMNVNGLACGIEMYFGKDVLTKNGNLIPIQWRGFNDKENKYQGVISDKKYAQNKIREKIKNGPSKNFEDINLLLRTIFNAFS